ncbi:MAG: GGDEF domain-containing protein [Desulfatiglans sp.]|nr:GGDEF domain-containing protein [Desulfatiglans sp.]
MSEHTADTSILSVLDSVDSIHAGIFVIDSAFRVLKANRLSLAQFGIAFDVVHSDSTCYGLLFNRPEICDDCPLAVESDQESAERAFILNKEGSGIYIRETISRGEKVIFLTFQDNINEVFLQKEMDSIKNELIAKNILLNRYRNGTEENRGVNQIIDNLPDALVTIDDSMNIRMINSKAKLDMPDVTARKCYELLGKTNPCKLCPVENGLSGMQEVKTSHVIGGKFFTEIINGFKKEEGGLLLFRDNTRQVNLIEQIRTQNETINRKNNILSSLVNLESRMQTDKNIKSVLEYFIDLFLPLYQSDSIALIASDIRAGSVMATLGRGVSHEKLHALTQAYFARDIHTVDPFCIPDNVLPWPDACQINLVGRTDKLVGMLFVKGNAAEDGAEIIDLFKDPLTTYMHNQILLRLLKERADTDSLTGLYNRRYLQKAMDEEKIKYEKYGIHYSVVVIDINGLKYVNDRFGHEAGDHMIFSVARNLKGFSRETDVVARTGGDEFIVLLTNTDDKGALKYSEKLRHMFDEIYFDINNTEKLSVTVSAGAASTSTSLPDDLIKLADRLMYESKREFYKKMGRSEITDRMVELEDDRQGIIADRTME